MKLIVAGGRDFIDISLMDKTIKTLAQQGKIDSESELVCGMARGADMTALRLWVFSYKNKYHEFKPDWDAEPRRAGFIRNEAMGRFADVLVAFWNGKSRGTKHMIDYMTKLNKPVYVIRYD